MEHIGSAHTDAELGVLIEQASRRLGDSAQGVLNLEAPSRVRVRSALPAPTVQPEQLRFSPPLTVTAGPGRVTATGSRLLFDVLAAVYVDLGFDVLGDGVLRDLVIARIVAPTSLLDTGRVMVDLGCRLVAYKTMQRTMATAASGNYRDRIAAACYHHASRHGNLTLVLYDVTTLYFEAEHEDNLRKVGFSKERRVDPQIVVGLLVDRSGFPLEIGCFEGNKAETKTILPIIKAFSGRHHIAGMVVVADAGMLSAGNLGELDAAGVGFIVGSKSTKASGDLASHFRWHGTAFADRQVIDTITPKTTSGPRENDPMRRCPRLLNFPTLDH